MIDQAEYTTETYRAVVGTPPLDAVRVTFHNAAAPAVRVVLIERPGAEAPARWARALALLLEAGA